MPITTTDQSTIVTTMIIAVLVLEFGAVLLSVRARSLFGFFGTMAAFSGTIGAVLMINAFRDWAAHFTPYQTVKGVETWRGTKTLFWANIDASFIEAFILIAIISAIPASILFVLNARRHDAQMRLMEELKKENALLKQGSSKRTSAKAAPVSDGSSSHGEGDSEEASRPKRTQSPIRRRHEANSLA